MFKLLWSYCLVSLEGQEHAHIWIATRINTLH